LGIGYNIDTPFAPFPVTNNVNDSGPKGEKIDRGTVQSSLTRNIGISFMDRDWFALQGNFFVDSRYMAKSRKVNFSDLRIGKVLRVYRGFGLDFIISE